MRSSAGGPIGLPGGSVGFRYATSESMSNVDTVVRFVPCLSDWKSSPPSARKLFVVMR